MPLDLNGTLGLGADACVFGPTTTCAPSAYAVPSQRELIVSGQQGAVPAAHVTLTWSAATPATDTLGIGLMTMGARECNCTTMLAQAKGSSPVTLAFANKNVTLAPGAVLHLFVYTIPQSAGPGYAYADEPQSFRVEGAATLVKV